MNHKLLKKKTQCLAFSDVSNIHTQKSNIEFCLLQLEFH